MAARRQHVTESVARQIAVELQSVPKPSYTSLAGKYRTSRDTVRRIDQQQHRPVRNKKATRCPGCGGLLRKKTACLTCLRRQELAAKRDASSAGSRRRETLTGLTPSPAA